MKKNISSILGQKKDTIYHVNISILGCNEEFLDVTPKPLFNWS